MRVLRASRGVGIPHASPPGQTYRRAVVSTTRIWNHQQQQMSISSTKIVFAAPAVSATMKAPTAPSKTVVKYFPGSETLEAWTQHKELQQWILQQYELCQPDHLYLCTGTAEENKQILDELVLSGVLTKCNESLRPNSFVARSTTSDVARVESRTFICSATQDAAGPTNNWESPAKMKSILQSKFAGCMKGRTLYVVPFCMGPLNSPLSAVGIQTTDSAYVVANQYIMTRMGKGALSMIGKDGHYVKCQHSVGYPLSPGTEDVPWPQNEEKYITHFPETKEIISYGSGYGGNALLGKKAYALRIASVMAHEEGWLAEHMLIMKVTNPQGVKKYVAAAFPSACGKTNFAMLLPSLPGFTIETVGDDIAWMRIREDGRLHAINPENGFFGVAPGTSPKTNPMALASCSANSLFTNVAMTPEGDVWWEGLSKEAPPRLISWLRRVWIRGENKIDECAHPNSRFTAPARQCPTLDPAWENPEGVPIDAIIFGGRRSDTVPLVTQSLSWEHGVYMGATLASETTAAAEGKRGQLRNDPFAMRPFCGYNFADYFQHWLSMTTRTDRSKLPKIFTVNWFRKSPEDGKFLWPGFGDNVRVLEWILSRCDGDDVATNTTAAAAVGSSSRGSGVADKNLIRSSPSSSRLATVETPIGYMPAIMAGRSSSSSSSSSQQREAATSTSTTTSSIDVGMNVDGLKLSPSAIQQLFTVDAKGTLEDLERNKEFLSIFGKKLPQELWNQHNLIKDRVLSMMEKKKQG